MRFQVKEFVYIFLFNLDTSFSQVIVLTRISSMMLHKSNKSRHSCLTPDLWGKAFSLSSLTRILAVGFLQMLFIE